MKRSRFFFMLLAGWLWLAHTHAQTTPEGLEQKFEQLFKDMETRLKMDFDWKRFEKGADDKGGFFFRIDTSFHLGPDDLWGSEWFKDLPRREFKGEWDLKFPDLSDFFGIDRLFDWDRLFPAEERLRPRDDGHRPEEMLPEERLRLEESRKRPADKTPRTIRI